MQATQTWRHAHSGTMIAAVAIVLLLTLALLYVLFESSGESVSESNTSALGGHSVDRTTFLEQNMVQIPYTPPRVLSAEEIAFWEANTLVQPSVTYVDEPALNWNRSVGQGEGYIGGLTEYEYGSDGSVDPSAAPATEYTVDPYAERLTEH